MFIKYVNLILTVK